MLQATQVKQLTETELEDIEKISTSESFRRIYTQEKVACSHEVALARASRIWYRPEC